MPHKFAQADPLFGCLRFGLACCLRIVCGVGAVVVMHRIIRAGVLTYAVLFLALLYPARATDLLPEAQQTAKSSESPFPTSLTVNVPQGSGCHVFPGMWHHYMTSFRRVFVLLVIVFATNTVPTLVLKSFDY